MFENCSTLSKNQVPRCEGMVSKAWMWLAALILICGNSAVCWSQMMQPARPKAAPSPVDPVLAAWNKADYAAAIAQFEQIIKASPGNGSLYINMAEGVANSVASKANELRQETLRAKQAARASQAKSGTPQAQASASPSRQKLPKTAAELAQMETQLNELRAAVARLQGLYEAWSKENTGLAVLPYALALMTDGLQFDKREQYFLKAIAIDPKFTDAYSKLAQMNATYNDRATAEYAKKAAESKPDDFNLKLTYARALDAVDPVAAAAVYRELVDRNKGKKDGAAALSSMIWATGNRSEQVRLIEEYRRDYPEEWKSQDFFRFTAFDEYLQQGPAKALAFAQECFAGQSKAGKDASGDGNKAWQQRVEFAQKLVDVQALMDAKNYSQAGTLLEQAKVPLYANVEKQLQRLKAEVADFAGDTAKAYELMATPLVNGPDAELQPALIKYGARLGKTPQQVDADIWSRRMNKAEQFKSFALKKLGGKSMVKLEDLRGKVVMVDFWYPG